MKFSIPLIAFALAATLAWPACKNDDDGGGATTCNLNNPDLSYNLNIKRIIDEQCISCHVTGSGVAGANGDFSTYEGLKVYLDNGKVLDRVVEKKDMPQGGGMSQAQRDSINCWIADNYPK